jgi:hypothetical protein
MPTEEQDSDSEDMKFVIISMEKKDACDKDVLTFMCAPYAKKITHNLNVPKQKMGNPPRRINKGGNKCVD